MSDKELSGRELEIEVARRVFGFRWFHCVGANAVERNQFLSPESAETWRELNWTLTEIDGPQDDQFNDDTAAPRFSESIEAAMEVVEKMMQRGFRYVLRGNFQNNGMHHAAFDDAEWADQNPLYQSPLGNSLPEAICRAALSAIENKQ